LFTFVPSEFWGEAVLTVISLINTIPSSHSSGLSSFEKLYGHVPDYSSFRVFGCTCFILRPHAERSKLSSRFAICIFLGYVESKKGYHCFDPITHKLYVSRHIVFLEHILLFSIPSTVHNLTRPDIIRIDPFLFRILIIYHHMFLVPQIPFSMFDQFILIILQVLTLYSLAHLKLYSHL
jgi:hypothetical protein